MVIEAPLNPTQIAGVIAFLATAVAAGLTAARKNNCSGGIARVWTLVALAHLAFAAEVVLGARHGVHDLLNTVLRDMGLYPGRASIQAGLLILCGLCITLGLTATQRWLRGVPRLTRHGQRAVFSTLAAGALFTVEAVSLHSIDQVLYANTGPVRAIAYLWICVALVALVSALAEIYKK
jgi:hypothetical protein